MSKLETERLTLRPFRRADAADFARLAGDWAVASMTSDIRYPFSEMQALAWLTPARGEVRFAIEREGQLIGGVGLLPPALGRGRARLLARPPVVGTRLRHRGRARGRALWLQDTPAARLLLGAFRRQPGFGARAGQARLRARRARLRSSASRAATTWRRSPTGSTANVPPWRSRCWRPSAARSRAGAPGSAALRATRGGCSP